MYARSTTIQAQPLSVDIGIAHVRDVVMPALQEIDGCVGLSLLVDRQSGRCIATSSWESLEAMRASAEQVAPIRDRAGRCSTAAQDVEEWDIAVLHRDHRSQRGRLRAGHLAKVVPEQFDRSLDFYRTSVLPEMEQLDGFCSASLMVDHPGMPARGVVLDVRQPGRDGAKPGRRDRAAQRRRRGTWAPRCIDVGRIRAGDRPPAGARAGLSAPYDRRPGRTSRQRGGRCRASRQRDAQAA